MDFNSQLPPRDEMLHQSLPFIKSLDLVEMFMMKYNLINIRIFILNIKFNKHISNFCDGADTNPCGSSMDDAIVFHFEKASQLTDALAGTIIVHLIFYTQN